MDFRTMDEKLQAGDYETRDAKKAKLPQGSKPRDSKPRDSKPDWLQHLERTWKRDGGDLLRVKAEPDWSKTCRKASVFLSSLGSEYREGKITETQKRDKV